MGEIGAVLSAAIINFILGAIWYTFFGSLWMKEWKLSERDINRKDPVPYLVAFIGSIWTSYGMFLIIKHIVPKSFGELFAIAFGTWLFIIVGTSAKHYAFAGKSLRAFGIDYLLNLIGIFLMSLILWGAV